MLFEMTPGNIFWGSIYRDLQGTKKLYNSLRKMTSHLFVSNIECFWKWFVFTLAMDVLDADDRRLCSNGKYAVRDIVQVILHTLCVMTFIYDVTSQKTSLLQNFK